MQPLILNPVGRVRFPESAPAASLSQRLKELTQSIAKVFQKALRALFPCFFRKQAPLHPARITPAPIAASAVSSVSLAALPAAPKKTPEQALPNSASIPLEPAPQLAVPAPAPAPALPWAAPIPAVLPAPAAPAPQPAPAAPVPLAAAPVPAPALPWAAPIPAVLPAPAAPAPQPAPAAPVPLAAAPVPAPALPLAAPAPVPALLPAMAAPAPQPAPAPAPALPLAAPAPVPLAAAPIPAPAPAPALPLAAPAPVPALLPAMAVPAPQPAPAAHAPDPLFAAPPVALDRLPGAAAAANPAETDEDGSEPDPFATMVVLRGPHGTLKRNQIPPPRDFEVDQKSNSDSEVDDGAPDEELDEELNQHYPWQPRQRLATPKTTDTAARARPSQGDRVWEGTFNFLELDDMDRRAAQFVVLQGIETISQKLALRQPIGSADLDGLVGRGATAFAGASVGLSDHPDVNEALAHFPHLETVSLDVQTDRFSRPAQPTLLWGTMSAIDLAQAAQAADSEDFPKPYANTFGSRIEQIVLLLQVTAKQKGNGVMGALLYKGSLEDPSVYGIFAHYNASRKKYDFYLLNPYGRSDRGAAGPATLHRFPGSGMLKNYFSIEVAPAFVDDQEHNHYWAQPIAIKSN